MQWTPNLSVGVEEIDNQHKELFNRINNLVDAIKDHTCKYKIGDVIQFLEDYIHTHFDTEEGYMVRFSYPEYPAHKAQHEIFKRNFAELRGELEAIEGGRMKGSYDLSVHTNQVVVDWILEHISTVDKRLGSFLKDKI